MANGSQKVYVINPPELAGKKSGSAADIPMNTMAETPPQKKRPTPPPPKPLTPAEAQRAWKELIAAYVAGPVVAPLWLRGKSRIAWAVVGGGSVVALGILALRWSSFCNWIDATPGGVTLWLTTMTTLVLTAVTAWVHAVFITARKYRSLAWPRWARSPLAVGGLGAIVPGLGLLIARNRRFSAAALWITGPVIIALIVLSQWRWLWARSQSAVSPGVSGTALETAFIVAACVLGVGLMLWLVQALEGIRRVSVSRSHGIADVVGVGLLVAVILFGATYNPASLAANLHDVSTALRLEGFRLVPLRLCEAANRLDPATPIYIADAAELNEALGMTTAASEKRAELQRRADQYFELFRNDAMAAAAAEAIMASIHQSLDSEKGVRSDGAWTRIRAQQRAELQSTP